MHLAHLLVKDLQGTEAQIRPTATNDFDLECHRKRIGLARGFERTKARDGLKITMLHGTVSKGCYHVAYLIQ